jgi:CSLREA domain-containing protein
MSDRMVRKVFLPGLIPLLIASLVSIFIILITPENGTAGQLAKPGGVAVCPPSQGPQPGPTLIVNTTVMTTCDGVCGFDHCTLREAIRRANTLPGANTIELGNAATYTLTNRDNGSNGLPVITSTITIGGNGSIIARSLAPGTPPFRLLQIGAGSVAFLDGITFKNGIAVSATEESPDNFGGSVFNGGLLTANRCIFTGNLANLDGGGIYTNQPMTITNSTLIGNVAYGVGGGIESFHSTVYVSNSTFNANYSPIGSAIDAFYGASLTLLNDTLAGNTGGSVLRNRESIVTAINTIFSGNDDPFCSGAFIDGGGNISQSGSGCPGSDGLAKLDPLADNGGETPTMALSEGSAAINAGVDSICSSQLVGNKDQRGVSRPQGRHCDSGAFEFESQPGPTLTVNNSAGTDDGLCSPGDCTLREAIFAANQLPGANTIELGAKTFYTLTEADNGSNGLPIITSTVTINGHGSTISRSGTAPNFRFFNIQRGAELTLTQLKISKGRLSSDANGGAIYNEGTLFVSESTFTKNTCDSFQTKGGALHNSDGTVTIYNTTFYSNSATSEFSYGGAIYSTGGLLDISNSTFADNLAGGNSEAFGGAIYNTSLTTITNSTFSGNTAKANGGAIFSGFGSSLILRNTIVANSPSLNNCYGSVSNGGGNLSWPDTSCPGLNLDPKLNPLANNGGQTLTMALQANSPAIDAAIIAFCPATDQRGFMRLLLNHCDIGAYEWVWMVFQPLIQKK